jgi:hypothetical protein
MPPVKQPKIPPFNDEQLLSFLRYTLDPGVGVMELRVFHATFERGFVRSAQQYSKTLAGWYDDPKKLLLDVKRLQGVSAYVTVNPVSVALLARCDNTLAKARHTTTDADVVRLRWLYIDIDPARPAEVSSTDAELAVAVERRDAILADHPEVRRASLYGRSGNGCWILVRLPDYPNDAEHCGLIARALAHLSSKYSDTAVGVDVKTKNPSRVMCLPGSPKCKGSPRPDRPWRPVTLDGVPEAAR